jgi:hypothetical protein
MNKSGLSLKNCSGVSKEPGPPQMLQIVLGEIVKNREKESEQEYSDTRP